jgi:ankyrin repeat protein/tetratricopeptide (TPR) repeat protein
MKRRCKPSLLCVACLVAICLTLASVGLWLLKFRNPKGLHLAISQRGQEAVEDLLRRGADPNERDAMGNSPLHTASCTSNSSAVSRLLDAGAHVDAQSRVGETPLQVAARDGAWTVVEMLLRYGADPDRLDDKDMAPLHYAVLHGGEAPVRALAAVGANLSIRARGGPTPLSMAASKGDAKSISLLIALGADLNVLGKDGLPPIYEAVLRGHAEAVEALVDAGAPVNARTGRHGSTPLHFAATQGHTDIVQILLSARGDYEAARNDGLRPIYMAACQGHADTVRALLETGAEPDARSLTNQMTALHMSAWRGHSDVVRALLAFGAEVDARSLDGRTPLMLAWRRGRTECVRALLAGGADLSARDNQGRRADYGNEQIGLEPVQVPRILSRPYHKRKLTLRAGQPTRHTGPPAMLRVPYVAQKGLTDCIAASLRMLLRYKGYTDVSAALSVEDIRVPGEPWGHLYRALRFLRSRNIRSQLFYPQDLAGVVGDLLRSGCPVLMPVKMPNTDSRAGHVLVVIGVSEDSSAFYCHDPLFGPTRWLSAAYLEEASLRGGGYIRAGLIVLAKDDTFDETTLPHAAIAPSYHEAQYRALIGDTEGGVAALESVVAADPGFVPAYIVLGGLYAQNRKMAWARHAFARAAEIDPEYYWGLATFKLAGAQFYLGQDSDALANLRSFLAINHGVLPEAAEPARKMAELLRSDLERRAFSHLETPSSRPVSRR